MVTCNERQCRKWANLDADGYCPLHSRNPASATQEDCKCGSCNETVSNDQEAKALQCAADKCKVWYHLSCTKISEALYDLMNTNSTTDDDGIRWICPKCIGSDPIVTVHQKPESDIAICPRLKHGTCPHGVTGKTEHRGKACEFRHPKMCKKFIKYGNKGRFGCKSGNSCEFFHPILCQKSVNFRKCFNNKCTLTQQEKSGKRNIILDSP